jgi:uncharacterized protein YndB with AHSA1/START domain
MEQDRIEREVDIAADAERVWSLVSRPGWWINDGELGGTRTERVGDLDVVHHPVHGSFPIRTEKLDPPRYAAFRWFLDASVQDEGPSTLTEFWIDDRPGGVVLRVAESGLSTLPGTEEERRRHVDDNTEGWAVELDVARRHAEGA